MGYTIKVGNAKPYFYTEEKDMWAGWEVEGTTNQDAPTFPNDDMTGNSNTRSPSYTAWAETLRAAGIYDFFFRDDGNVIVGHPGCQKITEEDYTLVHAAMKKWEAKATKPPGFDGYGVFNKETGLYENPDSDKYDPVFARLIWIDWWMRWALDTCENPAINNT